LIPDLLFQLLRRLENNYNVIALFQIYLVVYVPMARWRAMTRSPDLSRFICVPLRSSAAKKGLSSGQLSEDLRALLQWQSLGPHIGALAGILDGGSDLCLRIGTLQIVEECLALHGERRLKKLNESLRLDLEFGEAGGYGETEHAGVDFRRRRKRSRRQREQLFHSG